MRLYEATKFLLAICGGVLLSRFLQAQPTTDRVSVWRGTNSQGTILVVEERSTADGRDPLLSGFVVVSSNSYHLHPAGFTYRDNTFRGQYVASGQTNGVEVIYQQADGEQVIGLWGKEHVKFSQQE